LSIHEHQPYHSGNLNPVDLLFITQKKRPGELLAHPALVLDWFELETGWADIASKLDILRRGGKGLGGTQTVRTHQCRL
jgi:hypothetical protein